MTVAHIAVGALVIGLSLAATALGAWRWWRVEASGLFWKLLRAAQALLVLDAILGGVLLIAGRRPNAGLHYLYGLLPLAISFVAEQLRVTSADAVLSQRGHESARSVGELPDDEQRSVVLAIVQRELGVMTIAALVIFGLAVRAATTGG